MSTEKNGVMTSVEIYRGRIFSVNFVHKESGAQDRPGARAQEIVLQKIICPFSKIILFLSLPKVLIILI